MKAKQIRRIFAKGTAFLFLLICSVIFLMPLVLTFCDSFMTETEVFYNYGAMLDLESDTIYTGDKVSLKFIPDRVTLSQYTDVLLTNSDYLIKFWNAVILTVPVTALQITLGLLAAYGFAMYEGKVKQIIFIIYIILMLMPYQVTLVPNYLVADALGFAGSRWAVIIPGIFYAFPVYLFTRIMKRIPKACIEAAHLDGAGEMHIHHTKAAFRLMIMRQGSLKSASRGKMMHISQNRL